MDYAPTSQNGATACGGPFPSQESQHGTRDGRTSQGGRERPWNVERVGEREERT